MDILKTIYKKVKNNKKKIVLVEGEEPRTLRAVEIIQKNKYSEIILLGNSKKINSISKKLNLKINFSAIQIIDPKNFDEFDNYKKELFNLRKEKGLTLKKADELLKEGSYLGIMLVYKGIADGCVSGAIHSTADTVRPALQILKTKPGTKLVSSFFLMIIKDKTYLFSDCGLNINPDSKELAHIALESAKSAKALGLKPKVAMLSFSTKGSAKHEMVEKVISATKIAKKANPKLIIDGELQLDTAIVPEVAKLKAKNSKIQGDANILIFPNLDSGNIGYKLTQRLANAKAIGPILQGLNKPVNDLSRGCSAQDIVDLVCVTCLQAQQD